MKSAVLPRAAVALALVATPAAADPFCDTLAKIGAAAPTAFAAIRGKPDQAGGQYYSRALALPGSLTKPRMAHCAVYGTAEGDHFFYNCYFNGTDAGALSAKVAACLGQPATAAGETRLTVGNVSYSVDVVHFNTSDPIPGWTGIGLTVTTPFN